MTTILHLARHGEVHNPENIFYGRRPRFGLSERGRRQAAVAGQILANHRPSVVYHSPLLRARQTATIIAGIVGAPRRQSRLLLEVNSIYEGIPIPELEAREYDLYTGSPNGYEQPEDVLRRVQRFFARACRRHPDEHVVAVSHGDVLITAYLWAAGRVVTARSLRTVAHAGLYPTPASFYSFRLEDPAAAPVYIGYMQPVDGT